MTSSERGLSLSGAPDRPSGIALSLVGRERETALVCGLLQAHRLVTLSGAGGVGKTRLALAVLHALVDAGERGTFVDLAGIDDPKLVPATILASLRLRAPSDQKPLELIAVHVGDRPVILLLDNFEHVLAAASQVGELLARCPELRVLATSRSRLRLTSEWVHEVPPLDVPDPSAPIDALATFASVRLFLERASAAGETGRLATDDLPVVAAICRRLEGLPLAIELAASRTRHLSAQALFGRLDQPLPLLAGGPVDAPVRHQALRHTISWSYDLLGRELAAFFAELGVFQGSFALEAAHAVAGAGVGTSESETLEALTELAEQSLLRPRSKSGEVPRYAMHETVREFAVSVLVDESSARDRHLAYYVDLAERAEPELERADQAHWTTILTDDLENLRGALRWAQRSASSVALIRLAAAMGNYWRWHGDLREGRDWLARAALAAPPGCEALVCKTQRRAARIFNDLGEHDQARLLYEAARRNAEAAGDVDGLAESLVSIGAIHVQDRRLAEAEPFIEEGLCMARERCSAPVVAQAVLAKAVLKTSLGLASEAVPLFDEAIAVARRYGDLRMTGIALVNMAEIVRLDGGREAAIPLLSEATTYLEQTRALAYVPWANVVLAEAKRRLGDLAGARSALRRAASLSLDLDSPVDMIEALEALADWLGTVSAHREAVAAWATASNARVEFDLPRWPTDDDWINEGIARDRAAIGESAADEVWAAARRRPLRSVVSEGLSLLDAMPLGASQRAASERVRLTPRETEVLALLVQGRSDPEIADLLFISPKTASVHVANIRGKLGASSRVETVTRAVGLGLAVIPNHV